MNNISIELINRLPIGLREIYQKMNSAATATDCDYLVVGAMARDLILVHGFGAKIERGTRDVDFGINVESWSVFSSLKQYLVGMGFTADKREFQKLHYLGSDNLPWEIDVIPFGFVEKAESLISWPPEYNKNMSVLGFEEASTSSIKVVISKDPEIIVPVASPVGMCLLKLVAWLDRPEERRPKDAIDIKYLIETFSKIPAVNDELYAQGYMAKQDFDETKASAMKLGHDVGMLASHNTKQYLEKNLFSRQEVIESLAREMSGKKQYALAESYEFIQILIEAARP
ncbi:MAG: nucleotidyl transferase AbiEii/AbiGii toxin family protein [Pseudomonadota bacterium]